MILRFDNLFRADDRQRGFLTGAGGRDGKKRQGDSADDKAKFFF